MIIEYTQGTFGYGLGIGLIIMGIGLSAGLIKSYGWRDLGNWIFIIVFIPMGIASILMGLNYDYGFLVFREVEP